MNLVIAEKNELARDIAAAICSLNCDASSIKLPVSGNDYTVCAASGHLLELKEPGELNERFSKWNLEDLPISFYPWTKQPSSEYAESKLETICNLISECDGKIICAGDADDEGQLIVDEILEWAGIDPADDRCIRAYINDNLPENIRKEIMQASSRPNKDCLGAGRAAYARQLADMCFGVNESRLATCKLGASVAIGRVQTPTLGLVVERDLAREGHTKQDYYTLHVKVNSKNNNFDFEFKPSEELCSDGKHVFEQSVLSDIAKNIEGSSCQFDLSIETKQEAAPMPYNLTTLISDMNRLYGLSGDDVMAITQNLRDRWHAITYNRAATSFLKVEHFRMAPQVAEVVQGNLHSRLPVSFDKQHKCFNDEKLEGIAHHGIIPQEVSLNLSELSEAESKVYCAIALRYLSLFLPDITYKVAKATFKHADANGLFEYSAKKLGDAGWSEFALDGWAKTKGFVETLPLTGLHTGLINKCEIETKQTTPPKAFTEGSLITAMANISRYVHDEETKRILLKKDEDNPNEHGGIGTVATRSDIVAGLIEHGYLEKKNKNLVSTPKARKLYSIIPEQIRTVDLTAKWWLLQQQIAEGELEPDAIMNSVCEEFNKHKDSAYEGMNLLQTVGKCPKCGADVIQRGKVFTCSSNKYKKTEDGEINLVDGCGFTIYPYCGKIFSTAQATKLLEGKRIPLKGCVSKRTGNKFDCRVFLNAEHRIEPIFENKQKAYSNKRRSSRKRGW